MDEKMTPSDPEPNTKRPKRARPKSRLQRWAEAVKKANDALGALADSGKPWKTSNPSRRNTPTGGPAFFLFAAAGE